MSLVWTQLPPPAHHPDIFWGPQSSHIAKVSLGRGGTILDVVSKDGVGENVARLFWGGGERGEERKTLHFADKVFFSPILGWRWVIVSKSHKKSYSCLSCSDNWCATTIKVQLWDHGPQKLHFSATFFDLYGCLYAGLWTESFLNCCTFSPSPLPILEIRASLVNSARKRHNFILHFSGKGRHDRE